MKRLIVLFTVSFFLINCNPETVTPSIDYRIKTLTVLFNADTAFYNFDYNADNQLEHVTRNGSDYAWLTYSGSVISVIRSTFSNNDTTFIFKTTSGLIDSVKHYNDKKRIFRNSALSLDSIRNVENGISLFHQVRTNSEFILSYQQSLPYTCGVFNFCTETVTDSILYSSLVNQSNLPEQFAGIPLSEGFSFMDLNPVFLVQQSGIFPYLPSNHLREFWITKYSIFVSQSPPAAHRFSYTYTFDTQNRATSIVVYDILQSTSIPFKQYYMTY